MADFIDRQTTLNAVGLTTDAINFNPTKYVDAQGNELVAVVRCKDCKWWKTNYMWDGRECKVCVIEAYEPVRNEDDFCSRGERREEERLVMPKADGSTIKIGKMDEVEDAEDR